ncbi:hypothetical protein MAR_016988 [Mya arenaria]|uniref:Uncharacterized protein n=1 Tax=Mya arenaria TaxID=6604 RepID=A0ABY7EDB6_MYAAR|nr:uncharacterized protein LOC128238401 [Mya arenaria]XP_052810261.1 uncharacterized protein LOC128238401 [Mya arenaria]XP_052810262.1 uncharacterized protein LOC128238401 [Mya arenaria]WAR07030.1 hypothetical protein MAR_016988 [Mya arenaria]
MSAVPAVSYRLFPWTVYPRPGFFRAQYVDLHPRFRKIIDSLPAVVKNQGLLNKLDAVNGQLKGSLRINVISDADLSVKQYILDETVLQDTAGILVPSSLEICVCYIHCAKLDDAFAKHIDEVLRSLINVTGSRSADTAFLAFDFNCPVSDEDIHRVTSYVLQKLGVQAEGHRRPNLNIVFVENEVSLPSAISQYLESELVQVFHDMYSFVLSLIPKEGHKRCVTTLEGYTRRKGVHSAILAFMSDVHMQFGDVEGFTDEHIKRILTQLGRLFRCSIFTPYLQNKYGIPSWICSSVLDSIRFDDRFQTSVTDETCRFIIKTIENVRREIKEPNDFGLLFGTQTKEKRFSWVSPKLLTDLKGLLKEAEQKMGSVARVVSVVKKLAFEIEGYLEQAIGNDFRHYAEPPIVPAVIRKEILMLNYVYAVGTVYNDFVVYLNGEGCQSMETEELQEDQFSTLKGVAEYDIKALMKKHCTFFPYKIQVVSRPIKTFADNHYFPGSKISKVGSNGWGTLGGFFRNEHGSFAITCDHVLECVNEAEMIEIHDVTLGPAVIGLTSRDMSVRAGENINFSLVDIAAIKMNECDKCTLEFLDADSKLRVAERFEGNSSNLRRRTAFKHGAKSSLTTGIIVSGDFEMSSTDCTSNYVVLIEDKPGSAERFAMQGDSGSVICVIELDDHSARQPRMFLVSILFGGEMQMFAETFDNIEEAEPQVPELQVPENTVSVRLNVALKALWAKNQHLGFL